MNKLSIQDETTDFLLYTAPSYEVKVVCSILEHTTQNVAVAGKKQTSKTRF